MSAAIALAAALLLLVVLACDAMSDDKDGKDDHPAPKRELFGAQCRTETDGSRVRAYCHNPYPGADAVALHIECARWWDIDTDTKPREVDPAETVRLDGRCWKDVARVWVSHRKVRD
ncbi:hypothetical protein [Streptomyces sp. VRA16 Mangrove soil]|uniref:hypothetical protein n=1 Tax=Streptomyces sp. VRA16 Mangrove soil TaxID=2817434 RepID=UPI0027DC5094|nr:hypothetical protein [Streptomyces sp. VRA16 Mangrove soil]